MTCLDCLAHKFNGRCVPLGQALLMSSRPRPDEDSRNLGKRVKTRTPLGHHDHLLNPARCGGREVAGEGVRKWEQ